MKLKNLLNVACSLILCGAPLAASAQHKANLSTANYAAVVLPPGYVDADYSASVVRTLEDKYRLKLAGASPNAAFRWDAADPLPPGLAIDPATGQIFGTPARAAAKPYRFRVHVVDASVPNPAPLRLLLSLSVAPGRTAGAAPVLVPIASAPAESGAAGEGEAPPATAAAQTGGEDVEIPAIVPRAEARIPLKIKNPSIRQLEVVVRDSSGAVFSTGKTPDNLPRGEVQTFVEVKLAPGQNKLSVIDVDTGREIAQIPVTLKVTDKDPPAPQAPIIIKHSGLVPRTATETPVTFVFGDKVQAAKLSVRRKDKDGNLVALKGYETPQPLKLLRGQNEYEVTVPVAEDLAHDTVVTVESADPNTKVEPVSLVIKRAETSGPVEVSYSRLVNRDARSTPLQLTVNDPKISKVRVLVTDAKGEATYKNVIRLERGVDSVMEVIGLPSDDRISVKLFDASDPEKADAPMLKEFTIERREGGGPASTILTNSLYTRAIIGFEQAGASSSNSESKPFLDFFFTAPIRFKPHEDELPRVSAWGHVRLASLPQQVSNFGTFATGFVDPLAEGKLTELVQGFDFLAGLEGRLFGTDKPYASLIPGIKSRTYVYLVGGGGAISPLSADSAQERAQIFKVPAETNPQRQLFIERFGKDAAAKKYIGFVFPDRDRFLRQFYGGFRFKTFYYEGDSVTPINRFPAILDVMFGQNEAVTGGKLRHEVTDEKGRVTGKKRSLIMRLEAFYPFPVKEASFLYLYGTAMMKLNGGGVRITTPLFLERPESNVLLTNDDLFIAPTLQTNRDYYRFGIGVNLTELFNRRTTGAK